VLENFTEPLVAGVFHAAPERQSVLACFPHLREMERNSGSILFGICKRRLRQSFHSAGEGPQPLPSPLISFKQGMGSFAKALRLALAGDLLLDAPVASIHLHPEGLWQVETANCGVARARNVILATPAYRSAEILSSDFPSLCDALSAIPYAETALISFILAESSLSFQGSGILTGRESHSPLNAVTVSSNKFLDRAPKGYAVVRASIGGSRRPDLLTHEDRTLFQIAEGELERIFQRRIQPLSRSVQRWPRAVPLLEVGHRSSVENLLKELPGGLMLAGNYLYGTGIADCLSSARRAAYSARG
jgi:oxygen-dependent protoporphyrinogen oxidase